MYLNHRIWRWDQFLAKQRDKWDELTTRTLKEQKNYETLFSPISNRIGQKPINYYQILMYLINLYEKKGIYFPTYLNWIPGVH